MPRRPDLPCAGCGQLLWRSSTSLPAGQARCRACRAKVEPECGTPGKYKRGCRCDVCRAFKVREQTEWNAAYKARTGIDYRRRYDHTRTPKPHEYTEAMRRRDAARRARFVGARVESFTHAEVYERDGWVCGICAEPVDRALVYPDPLSPSLDHVVPLSLGGEHSRANTRLAHLSCNVKRGAARGEDLIEAA